jgi:taurine dioxygenase
MARTDYGNFTVEPMTGALGATVHGLDLAQVDDAMAAAIRAALLEHLVLLFPDQDMTPYQHLDLTRRFGPIVEHPYVECLADHPGIIEIVKEADEEFNWGGGWHTDMPYESEPPLGAILFAREVPPWGGDTLFANLYLAFDSLSGGMKNMLNGMKAVHRSWSSGVYSSHFGGMAGRGDGEIFGEQPVIRTHPETGRKLLFVNRAFTWKLAGMTEAESKPILDYLFDHSEQPAFTCRFRWRPNDVAFWDNRSVIHDALSDYHAQRMGVGFRRVMHRATVGGDAAY